MRLLVMLTTALLASAAQAARVEVHLPAGGAALRVWDATPPTGELRIDCPPLCVHTSPGNGVDIYDLRVEPLLDPRNGDRPWDIVGMPGCRGTSALPADNGKCFLPFRGRRRHLHRPRLPADPRGDVQGIVRLAAHVLDRRGAG